ncbi:MAG TPA: uroporphyrinogen decarboxylase [Anaerolineaceae bacterium]|nr:uroporphyrinogen decarboxylase [Anaerolineaceae bacterium]
METLTSSQRFLNACWQKPVDRTPVWFMRQAGRFLSEYRAIRAHHTLLEICAQPELAAQVTLQPVTRLGVDAAILFADILLPLVPMGIQLEFAAGEGPVIHNPIRSAADVAALHPVEPRESLANVLAAIRIVRKELDGTTALIGFAGAPFTLASYLIEGGSSRNLLKTKRMMYSDPQSWHRLMEKLAQVIADYLSAQIDAGAQAVQLFDSWVGTLTPDDYREYVLPYSKSIFAALQNKGVPTIHFGTGTASLLPLMKEAGGNVIGIDWQTPLDWAWKLLDHQVAVQGNLDPVAFYAPEGELEKRVERVLRQAGGRPGHIFNLGHGILPDTPVDQVKRVVDLVHEWSYQPVE